MFDNVFQFPWSPRPLKIPLFTVFSDNFSMFAMPVARLQHIYKTILPRTLFLTVFFTEKWIFQFKQTVIYTESVCHKGSKPFQRTLLLTVFLVSAPTSHSHIWDNATRFLTISVWWSNNTCHLQCFQSLCASNPIQVHKSQLWPSNVFLRRFSLSRFYPLPEHSLPESDAKIPFGNTLLQLRHPNDPSKRMSKTPPYSGLRCESPVFGPPPHQLASWYRNENCYINTPCHCQHLVLHVNAPQTLHALAHSQVRCW